MSEASYLDDKISSMTSYLILPLLLSSQLIENYVVNVDNERFIQTKITLRVEIVPEISPTICPRRTSLHRSRHQLIQITRKVWLHGLCKIHINYIIPAMQDDHKALVELLEANLVGETSGFNTQQSPYMKLFKVIIRRICQNLEVQHVKNGLLGQRRDRKPFPSDVVTSSNTEKNKSIYSVKQIIEINVKIEKLIRKLHKTQSQKAKPLCQPNTNGIQISKTQNRHKQEHTANISSDLLYLVKLVIGYSFGQYGLTFKHHITNNMSGKALRTLDLLKILYF